MRIIVKIEESVREPSVPNLPGVQPRWRFFSAKKINFLTYVQIDKLLNGYKR